MFFRPDDPPPAARGVLAPRRLVWLVGVGVTGGLAGLAFMSMLSVARQGLGPDGRGAAPQIVVLVGAGLFTGVLAQRWGSTGGVDLLVDNIHVLGGPRERRGLLTVIPSAVVGIAAGGTLGPEAPLVESTGTVGSVVADRLGWRRDEARVLAITGMAAGFSVLFGTPIGAAVFALEILHRDGLEYYEALVPSLIGSLSGLVVYELAAGRGLFRPLWEVVAVDATGLESVLPVVIVAVVGAGVAYGFVVLTRGVKAAARHLPTWMRPAAGGLVIGVLALWSPYALTFGEDQLPDLLAPGLGAAALLVAGSVKLVASAVCAGTEWKGGFIIPLFFVGAAAGQALHPLFPGVEPSTLVTCGMVAACVGVTKTPLGSTLVVAGMTGYASLPLLLVAAIISFLLTRPVTHFRSQRPRSLVAARAEDGGPGTHEAGGADPGSPDHEGG
jgi:H+/Cl- antiporter ClcA